MNNKHLSHFAGLLSFALATTVTGITAQAQTQTLNFARAKWIWHQPATNVTLNSFEGGTVYFRLPVTLPAKPKVKSAEIIATADNLFTLYVNGKIAGESENWSQPKRINLSTRLKPGQNLIAFEASNTAMGPAGLLVKIVIALADGQRIELVSDAVWKCNGGEVKAWAETGFDDTKWKQAYIIGDTGIAPWGEVAHIPAKAEPARTDLSVLPENDFKWPDGGIAFIGDDCSLYRETYKGAGAASLGVTVFTARKSRSYPEHDLPAPIKVGHKLYLLKPLKAGAKPEVILDAGTGAIGTPCCSYDGKWIYVSMVLNDEPFYHIYRISSKGGRLTRLTDGPFHDIDPAELPDGRIVFTSTRIGTFEEYHNPPSRSLFTMDADGRDIQPLTHTFVFDNEARVLADGRIIFIRSDNFFDRGKVETLLSAIHPDGTHGYTEFGLDLGPEYGGRLRAFYCGSPAPMPDGRVAFVSGGGIIVGRPGSMQKDQRNIGLDAGDVAAMPDGRLICTLARKGNYTKLGIIDPDALTIDKVPVVYDAQEMLIHSPTYVGPRQTPPILSGKADKKESDNLKATGFLFCQNARFTKNTTAGWPHVRAIRVIAGKGLTTRSSHSYIVHAGNETVELGTVPIAPDGSFSVEVPADTAIAFQAVDAEGRSELNEMSWIFVKPGERRSCIGCHQTRQATPSTASNRAQALQTEPLKLLGQGRPHHFRGNNAAVTGMMEMQFDRYREVAGLNRYSESSDPFANSKTEVAGLITQLKTGDDNLKISSANRLAVFRDHTAAQALAGRLREKNREVRVAAAMSLAACGTRDSVQPLLDTLTDTDPLVAQAASIALENLTGHTEAFNAFTKPDERLAGAGKWRDWFHAAGWAAIEQDLVHRIGNTDSNIARRAAVALGHTGSDAARQQLRAYLTTARDFNPLPEWRKSHQGDGAKFNSLSDVNPRKIQAVTRSLGYLKDKEAVPLLAETLYRNSDPATGNLFLAEACVEALGSIATPEVEPILTNAFTRLKDYIHYTSWYGDHGALMACHASPVHYFILETLDRMESRLAGGIVPCIIRSVPTDFDRALFIWNDDYETLAGRVIRRNDPQSTVIETCLAILGDPQTNRTPEIALAIATVHGAWGGKPDLENRAAQILSLTCRDRKFEPRIRAALDRYRTRPNDDIERVFSTGIPVVNKLPIKNWVCFFLARNLGHMADPNSVDSLLAVLEQTMPEAATGYPDPKGPGVLFLHNGLTPCYRAAAAWALGIIRERKSVPTLLKVVENLQNAPDTRHAAAVALDRIGDESSFAAITKLVENYPDISTRKALLHAARK